MVMVCCGGLSREEEAGILVRGVVIKSAALWTLKAQKTAPVQLLQKQRLHQHGAAWAALLRQGSGGDNNVTTTSL